MEMLTAELGLTPDMMQSCHSTGRENKVPNVLRSVQSWYRLTVSCPDLCKFLYWVTQQCYHLLLLEMVLPQET